MDRDYLVIRIGYDTRCHVMEGSAIRRGLADGSILQDPETGDDLTPMDTYVGIREKEGVVGLRDGLYIIDINGGMNGGKLVPPRPVEKVTVWEWGG